MKKLVADKWVEALRSGDYKQTQSFLYDGEGYCCLGVLCEVMGKVFKSKYVSGEGGHKFVVGKSNDCRVLPDSVQKKAGMFENNGTSRNPSAGIKIGKREFCDLADANDSGATFRGIANYIEKNYKDL